MSQNLFEISLSLSNSKFAFLSNPEIQRDFRYVILPFGSHIQGKPIVASETTIIEFDSIYLI